MYIYSFQIGKEEGVCREVLHKVQNLMLQDHSFSVIKEKVKQYVIGNKFYKETPPDTNDKRYYPGTNRLKGIKDSVFKMYFLRASQLERLEKHFKKMKEDFGAKISFKIEEPPKFQPTTKRKTSKQLAQKKKINGEQSLQNVANLNDDDQLESDEAMEIISSTQTTSSGDGIDDSLTEVTSKRRVSLKTQKVYLFYQSKCQQSLLNRYGSYIYISEIKTQNIGYRTVGFALFLICVRTNVDCQVVGTILCNKYNDHKKVLKEALTEFKEINEFWKPKYLMIDPSEAKVSVVKELFPGSFMNSVRVHFIR